MVCPSRIELRNEYIRNLGVTDIAGKIRENKLKWFEYMLKEKIMKGYSKGRMKLG